jgi:hypothetical protein
VTMSGFCTVLAGRATPGGGAGRLVGTELAGECAAVLTIAGTFEYAGGRIAGMRFMPPMFCVIGCGDGSSLPTSASARGLTNRAAGSPNQASAVVAVRAAARRYRDFDQLQLGAKPLGAWALGDERR